MLGFKGLLLVVVAASIAGRTFAQSPGFLLISAPRSQKISWVHLPAGSDYSKGRPETLIDTGLHHPQGVAVDQIRKRLYVADPDVQTIYCYQLVILGEKITLDKTRGRVIVTRDAEARWVAVDGVGNLFFSDESRNLILKVPAEKATSLFETQHLRGSEAPGDIVPEVVYNGATVTEVNEPGGVAVDNFHVFWTNKHFGTQAGSLVRGSETPQVAAGTGNQVTILAQNTAKSYGVCLALNNIFFTDSKTFLYGVKKTGGASAEVSAQLKHPRGCAWDGDGTVFVADRGHNAIFSFASNMQTLGATKLTKAYDAEDAFGVAVVVSPQLAYE